MLEDLSPEGLEVLQTQLGEAEDAVDALAELLRMLYETVGGCDQALIEDTFRDLRLDL